MAGIVAADDVSPPATVFLATSLILTWSSQRGR
jgi:hypothetical protein